MSKKEECSRKIANYRLSAELLIRRCIPASFYEIKSEKQLPDQQAQQPNFCCPEYMICWQVLYQVVLYDMKIAKILERIFPLSLRWRVRGHTIKDDSTKRPLSP